MELIAEILESEIIESSNELESKKFNVRKSSRAVVVNSDGKIALLFVSNNNYHKLPGGGVEEGENLHAALKREIIEEVGSQIDIMDEIGLVIEYRNKHELLQLSYSYFCKVVGEIGSPKYTNQELDSGFQLIWIGIEEAILILRNDRPNNYIAQFIQRRDLAILEKVREKM
ncbi:NUDIX domain-containing protein [Paenibacillus sp. EC2-1]|uniref:NUDIX domain-containing protein n=1 Tax=Paenibacillus sp. EC2-1 TaxID=3388665 RepID=UPI003BEEED36